MRGKKKKVSRLVLETLLRSKVSESETGLVGMAGQFWQDALLSGGDEGQTDAIWAWNMQGMQEPECV